MTRSGPLRPPKAPRPTSEVEADRLIREVQLEAGSLVSKPDRFTVEDRDRIVEQLVEARSIAEARGRESLSERLEGLADLVAEALEGK